MDLDLGDRGLLGRYDSSGTGSRSSARCDYSRRAGYERTALDSTLSPIGTTTDYAFLFLGTDIAFDVGSSGEMRVRMTSTGGRVSCGSLSVSAKV